MQNLQFTQEHKDTINSTKTALILRIITFARSEYMLNNDVKKDLNEQEYAQHLEQLSFDYCTNVQLVQHKSSLIELVNLAKDDVLATSSVIYENSEFFNRIFELGGLETLKTNFYKFLELELQAQAQKKHLYKEFLLAR